MAKAWNQTRVSEALGIEYPIIQGPLGGLSSERLTTAVSISEDSDHSARTVLNQARLKM
jgi:NAD(P)H-dependent flavin oxidoreductase YrpB (nitropropane dioxygenase family)